MRAAAGIFLRRRERAKSEFRRRNIFELYIEEVVEACNRLKGGKLPKEKLKEQLQKIAMKRTGGEKTDEVLGYDGSGPEGLPHSIIVTAEGTEGDAPVIEGRNRNAAEAEELARKQRRSHWDGEPKPKRQTQRQGKATPEQAEEAEPTQRRAGDKQMSLAFRQVDRTPAKSVATKTGRKHGAKKAKK